MSRLTNRGTNGEIWITDNDETRKYGRKETAYKKLASYEDKEEQGLLIELPVPIGTEVYKVVEDKTASTIETIKHNGHEYHRTIPCYFVCRDLFTFSMMKEVGKTVFLTLDEARNAEEALAKMGE